MTFNPLELAQTLGDQEGPTRDMVQRGYHGNGVWDSSPEAMAELTERSRQKGAERRAARIEAYDRKMIGKLETAAEFQGRLLDQGARILKECEADERNPTPHELDIIKRAQVAAEVIPNRTIGKAAARVEHSGQIDLVGIIAGTADVDEFEMAAEDIEEIDEDSDDDSWSEE